METISLVITAFATAAIAWLAWETKKSQDRFQEQLSDLYQGIIIATLLSSITDAAQLPTLIGQFNKTYKGKTEIFKK